MTSSGQGWTGINFCTGLVLVLGSKADFSLGMYGRYKPGVGTDIRRVYTLILRQVSYQTGTDMRLVFASRHYTQMVCSSIPVTPTSTIYPGRTPFRATTHLRLSP